MNRHGASVRAADGIVQYVHGGLTPQWWPRTQPSSPALFRPRRVLCTQKVAVQFAVAAMEPLSAHTQPTSVLVAGQGTAPRRAEPYRAEHGGFMGPWRATAAKLDTILVGM